ncbi:PH domain-containing protein [bacterium]|nr:PH domain-containing protein [bacterium]MBU1984502.1 PH domain-containing protein [bacterium]
MEIRPSGKLIIKQWLTLLTLSVCLVIVGLLLHLLLPLSPDIEPSEVSSVVWPLTLGCILLMWIIAVPIVILWIKNLSYRIEEDRVTISKGVLTKIQQNIPYRAITDFALNRSLYDRWLGIGAIRIQTAGQGTAGTGYEGQLSGLLDWQSLHTELRSRLKQLHPHTDMALGVENPPVASASDRALLQAILDELRAIRKALEK